MKQMKQKQLGEIRGASGTIKRHWHLPSKKQIYKVGRRNYPGSLWSQNRQTSLSFFKLQENSPHVLHTLRPIQIASDQVDSTGLPLGCTYCKWRKATGLLSCFGINSHSKCSRTVNNNNFGRVKRKANTVNDGYMHYLAWLKYSEKTIYNIWSGESIYLVGNFDFKLADRVQNTFSFCFFLSFYLFTCSLKGKQIPSCFLIS